MGRPKSKTEEAQVRQARKRRRRLVVAGILSGAVLVGVGIWFVYPSPLGAAAPYQGGPRLAVDREEIDFGPVRFGKMVQARFRVKNLGDLPLQIATAPRVEVVEGC